MHNIIAIILARGGSKGIPKKNILDFCGKPLIVWTIQQCISSEFISEVWVSSDSDEILDIAKQYSVKTIKRPHSISDDKSTSEEAWQHAIEEIEKNNKIDFVFAPQITSPIRETKDIDNAIKLFLSKKYDSLFSSCIAEDLFFWENNKVNNMRSVNYDYRNRQRRQDIQEQIIENGSFYIFRPKIIKEFENRLGGNIGHYKMELWKMFEIDNFKDLKLCSVLMNGYLLSEKKYE